MVSQVLFGTILFGIAVLSFTKSFRHVFNVSMVVIIVVHFLFFNGLKFSTPTSAALLFNLSLLKYNENDSLIDFFHSVIFCLLTGVCLLVLNPDVVFLAWVLISFIYLIVLYVKKIGNHLSFSLRYITFIVPILFFSLLLFLIFPRFTQGFYGTNVSQLIKDYGIKKLNFSELAEVSQSSQSIFKVYGLPPEKINLSNLYWRESVYVTFKDLVLFESNSVSSQTQGQIHKIDKANFYFIKPSTPFKRFLPHLEGHSGIDLDKHFISRTVEDTLKLKYSQSLIGSFAFNLNQPDLQNKGNLSKYLSMGETNAEVVKNKFPKLTLIPKGSIETINELNLFFTNRKFVYNKSPPQYKSLEDFLLNGSSGYCVHFSISYAWLLRLLNIPSRVVSGYQGGEINPFNNSINVRELDGHMWVEYFLNDKWNRVDPTEFVVPGRSSTDMNEFLTNLDSKNEFFQISKLTGIDFHRAFLFFDFLLSEVDLSISTIDQAFQKKLFSALLTAKNAALVLAAMLMIYIFFFIKKFFSVPRPIRQYRALILEASQLNLLKSEVETANEFLTRLENEKYHNLDKAKKIIDEYNKHCYRE